MELHIEVQDNKADLITKLLEHLPFVEIKAVKAHKEQQSAKSVTPQQKGKGRQLTFL